MYQQINKILARIKDEKPLILNITNYVTMDFVANGLLSIGASPIMTQSFQEIDDLLIMANAVVINIGTLTEDFISLCKYVCLAANQLGIPITLDPVGAGASRYRTNACLSLLEQFNFSLVRGNASEIMSLSNTDHSTKGVDTTTTTYTAIESAQCLSSRFGAIFVISGSQDAVVDGDCIQLFDRGSPLMPMVTGSGCLLSAVLSVFDALHHHRETIAAGVVFYSICGEIAARNATGPGSFKPQFLDSLSSPLMSSDYENN